VIVCLCNNITENDVKLAVDEGRETFSEVLKTRKARFQCRTCESLIREFFEEAKISEN
jgi:bacterioferritin-associated ferredoxin